MKGSDYMRVIELLNRIANGDIDDLPDAIKYKGNVYGYDGLNENYVRTINYTMDFLIGEDITAMLNDEVEVIEDKRIRKLPKEVRQPNNFEEVVYIAEDLVNKINEIIDYLEEDK